MQPFLKTGLLTANDKKWMKRRRILTPAFHFNILHGFSLTFREESSKFIANIQNHNELTNVGAIDLLKIIPRFTLNTICETAMGVKLETTKESDTYRNQIFKIGELLVYRVVRPRLHNNFLYNLTKLPKLLNEHLKPVHSFTWNVIDKRRQEFQKNTTLKNDLMMRSNNDDDENIYETKRKRFAMLDTLLLAESNGEIDGPGIQEEVDTFMFGGYDTISAALTFLLFMLAHHCDVQDKVYDEVKTIMEETIDNNLTIQQLNNMKYLDRVIKETLRLYPPAPLIGRRLLEPLQLENKIELPIGTEINIHIFDLHRDPEQFPDPEKFDPDRFLPEECDKRHPFAYIPFSAGPRNCIGQKFAMLEMKTLISYVLWNFKLKPITQINEVEFVTDIILKSKNPIEIQFQNR